MQKPRRSGGETIIRDLTPTGEASCIMVVSCCKDIGVTFDKMTSDPVQKFRKWVDKHALEGLTSEGKAAKYIPHSMQSEYWNSDNIREIVQSRNLIASAKEVQDFICIFSILVYIEGDGVPALDCVGEMMRRGFDDTSLPWYQSLNGRHDIFGGTGEGRLDLDQFIDTQWMFFPMPTQPFLTAHSAMPSRVLMPNGQAKFMNNRLVNAKQIFPITEVVDRPTDASRTTRRVTVSHMKVHPLSSTQQPSSTPTTVVFKVYPPGDEETYNDERRGYTAMRDANNCNNILQCLGSFYYMTDRGEQYSTIMSELADSGTLRDLFSGNKVPYRIDHVRAIWKSFAGILNGLAAMHNQIHPHGYLCFHQDLKPSNFFLFGSNDDKRPFDYTIKIGDFGSSYSRSANPAFQTLDIPDKGATRIYGPPETFLSDTCNFKPESSADMWAIGCIIIEMAVWITGGSHALSDFRHKRMEETKVLIEHESLGRSDCFHDGNNVLKSVKGVVETINEKRQRHDYITPAMVELALNDVLIEKNERVHAHQLIPRMRRILLDRPESQPSTNGRITQQASWLASSPAHCNLDLISEHKPQLWTMNSWSADTQTLNQCPESPASETSTSSSSQFSDNSQPKLSTTEASLNPGPFPFVQLEIPRESLEGTMKSCYKVISTSELRERANDCRIQNRELRCQNEAKSLLDNRDFVFLIDNSKHMKNYGEEIRTCTTRLLYLLKKMDSDGIDVASAPSPQAGRPIETKNETSKFFKQVFTRKLVVDCLMEKKRLNRVLDPIKAKWSQRRNGSMMSRRDFHFMPGTGQRYQRYRNAENATFVVLPIGGWDPTLEDARGAEKPILRPFDSIWEHKIPGTTQISTHFMHLGLEECAIHKLEVLDAQFDKPLCVISSRI